MSTIYTQVLSTIDQSTQVQLSDIATKSDLQKGNYVTLSGVTGTNAITATSSPAITSYTTNQTFRFIAAGTNTGAVTISINGLAAIAVTKQGSTALSAGDIVAGQVMQITYDGTRFQLIGVATTAVASTSSADRSAIINGNFGINQRAVSGTVSLAAGIYGHDRWKAGTGGCTYTFATSQNVTTITITAGTLVQVIEGVNLQSGSYILSWTGTATGRVDSGSYGASGTIGTAVGGTNQSIEFSTGTVSKVQYEPGTAITNFTQRQYQAELALCQRYLPAWITTGATQSVGATGMCYSTTAAEFQLPYPVQPRVIPTGITATANRFGALTSAGSISAASTPSLNGSASTLQALSILLAGTSGLTAGNATILYSTAGAGTILATGCEL